MDDIISITHNEKKLFSQLLHMVANVTSQYEVVKKDAGDPAFNSIGFLLTDGDSPFTMQITIIFPHQDIVAEIDIVHIDKIVLTILSANYALKKGKYLVFVEHTRDPLNPDVIE